MVFYTFLDKCNLAYFLLNDSFKQIQYPIYFLVSNVKEDIVKEKFPDAHILITDNNMQWKFRNFIKLVSPQIAVKVDLDALIFDYSLLIQKISQIKENQILGNLNKTYIRGGCNAICVQDLVDLIPEQNSNSQDVDIWLSLGLYKKGIKLVNFPLFEQSEKYSGLLPVWHPEKKNKMRQFLNELKKWRQKTIKLQ